MQVTVIIYVAWQSYTRFIIQCMLHRELLFIDISSHSSNAPKLTLSQYLARVQWQCDFKKKSVLKINVMLKSTARE